jgi:D-arabinonate dehydratase
MLAAIPHGICVECFADPARDPLWPHLLPDAPRPKDGMLAVPDRPGFGIRLDQAAVAKYTIATATARR